MRTTVDIREPLLRQARARAALDGIKMMDVVNEALSRYLGMGESEGDSKLDLPRRVKPEQIGRFCVPVIQSSQSGLSKAAGGNLKALDGKEDEERHAKVFGR